jgi:PGM1 C-terminal domain
VTSVDERTAIDPGSPAELEAFASLQARLAPMYRRIFSDRQAPRTVVVVPSLSLDLEVQAKITGVTHYEERMLCLLMLLRLPRTHLVYVTSQQVHPAVIDYYLHLLPGVPARHARERLTLLDCADGSPLALTEKILDRPRLVSRMREVIGDPMSAHLTCFNATARERTLAVQLGIPLYACDPSLSRLGSKSGARQLLRECGITVPDGKEGLRDLDDVVEAAAELRSRDRSLRAAVIKLDEGFSGEGNALFRFDHAPDTGLVEWVRRRLPAEIVFEAESESMEPYLEKLARMGGVVEAFVEGPDKRSPSVQCRINPVGEVEVISTHDQALGGPNGQVFLGASFPADGEYRHDLHRMALDVGRRLAELGVLGRFGVDFISTRAADGTWMHNALEINLRKGGTTLPFMMLEFLTDGAYDLERGEYLTAAGQPRSYVSSDNVESPFYRGMTPDDLIDLAVYNGLHFEASSQAGVVFHLMGALSRYGKLGLVAIGEDLITADQIYRETLSVLDREAGTATTGRSPPDWRHSA